MDESHAWRERAIANLRQAFAAASQPADRLALARSWVRMAGGWLPAADAPTLGQADLDLAERFGLIVGPHGIRAAISEYETVAEGLEAALRLDADSRRAFRPADPDAALLRFSDHTAYQSETQKAALRAVLTAPPGASLAVSMPTGSGKSLLFQAGPRAWRETNPGACALVITPLVGLAQDHERTLRTLTGLGASRALYGGLPGPERDDILAAFRRGEIPVLFTSPEIAFGATTQAALINAAAPLEEKPGVEGRLCAVFIDEAHIIESWGRTFRPDFQRLPGLVAALRAANPALLTVLLSATLSPAARQVLRQAYGQEPWLEIHAGAPRYDADVVVRRFDDPDVREATVLRAVDLCPRPAIVYTTRVEDATRLHDVLKRRGYRRLGLFTGETGPAERQAIIDAWAGGGLDLVVGTSAFGLGIDKADVRTVIHACLPESAARWYQEIGRAGRDGRQALALTLWTDGFADDDANQAVGMSGGDWLTRPYAEERWKALIDHAETAWSGDKRILTVPLNAAPARLGRFTGGFNRRWNQSLINLVQRAGLLRVDTVDVVDDVPRWRFALLDDALISDGPAWDAAWDQIFAVRDAEQAAAMADSARVVRVMRASGDRCLLLSAFALIEPEVWDAQPCGRCPSCRAAGRAAPGPVRPGGMEVAWGEGPPLKGGPSGLLLIRPDDPDFRDFTALIGRLNRAGVVQVIAPDGRAAEVAAALADTRADLGLVISHSDWVDRRWRLANAPTAALLTSDAPHRSRWLAQAREFMSAAPRQRLLLIADPTSAVDGRRLDQLAPGATYEESFLETLATRTGGMAA